MWFTDDWQRKATESNCCLWHKECLCFPTWTITQKNRRTNLDQMWFAAYWENNQHILMYSSHWICWTVNILHSVITLLHPSRGPWSVCLWLTGCLCIRDVPTKMHHNEYKCALLPVTQRTYCSAQTPRRMFSGRCGQKREVVSSEWMMLMGFSLLNDLKCWCIRQNYW